MDLNGKRVLVVGLGRSGIAAAQLCAARGARVTVTDKRDAGALGHALGGALGFVGLATKTELALPIIGGLFVAEAVSDIIQVAYYKRTKKRIFLMAPIHHHFEKLGWPESRIVVRFWIVSFACAILGLITTLKVR